MYQFRTGWVLLVTGLGLLGCSTMGPNGSLDTTSRLTVYGANPQFDNEKFEVVDLPELLDPSGLRFGMPTPAQQPALAADALVRRDLERAFAAFYDPRYNVGTSMVERRTRLQDRLIAASNQRCEAYKIYLRRFEAYQDTSFGLATTVLGGAAAIVGGLRDAKILGGLAGISSGSRAELRQGLFGNLASFIIVPGIDQRRKEIWGDIQSHRGSSSTNNIYTVQAAISDVALYHGACTLEAGMEQAKNAIQTVANPGLLMVRQTLNSVMQARLMAQAVHKIGSGEKLTDEDLRIPSFTVGGERMNNQAYTVASGSAVTINPSGDDVASMVRDTGAGVLVLLHQLHAQTTEYQAGLKTEQSASTPVPDKATLAAADARLGEALTKLGKLFTTVAATTNTSEGNSADANACLQRKQLAVTAALPAARVTAQVELDAYRAMLAAQLGQWSQTQTLQMNSAFQTASKALAALAVEGLRKNGITTAEAVQALPIVGQTFDTFKALDKPLLPASCTVAAT